jgi:hypothetical protein
VGQDCLDGVALCAKVGLEPFINLHGPRSQRGPSFFYLLRLRRNSSKTFRGISRRRPTRTVAIAFCESSLSKLRSEIERTIDASFRPSASRSIAYLPAFNNSLPQNHASLSNRVVHVGNTIRDQTAQPTAVTESQRRWLPFAGLWSGKDFSQNLIFVIALACFAVVHICTNEEVLHI